MNLGFKKQFVSKIKSKKKIHTIREDKGNRWKPGKLIHFATGIRTKEYNCFLIGECKGVQKIKIIHGEPGHFRIYIDGVLYCEFFPEHFDTSPPIIVNDGFETVRDFYNWFNADFEGRLIHWTDFKY